jgi:hypothetical protein
MIFREPQVFHDQQSGNLKEVGQDRVAGKRSGNSRKRSALSHPKLRFHDHERDSNSHGGIATQALT